MTQQPGWGQQPQQQFPQQGYAPQQQQFPQQGYAPQQQAPWGQQAGQPQQQYQGPAAVASVEGEAFDDFFSGGEKGAPGFDFGATQNGGEKQVGSMVMGEIVHMVKQQQRDYATGNPLFFDGGDPRMQVAITLQTDLRGWAGVKPKLIPKDDATGQPKGPEHDDGKRRVYVKGDMVRAINQACAAAGQKPRVGGKLAVAIRGFEPTNKGNDKTLYDAQYVPAPEKVATDSFFGQQQPPQGQAFPQVAQQGFPAQQAPQQGFAQQAPAYAPPAGQGYEQAPVVSTATGQPVVHQQQVPAQVAGYEIQPQGGPVPGTQPSTLGQGQAPAAPPEWAQQAPQQAVPAGAPQYDAPPF